MGLSERHLSQSLQNSTAGCPSMRCAVDAWPWFDLRDWNSTHRKSVALRRTADKPGSSNASIQPSHPEIAALDPSGPHSLQRSRNLVALHGDVAARRIRVDLADRVGLQS